MTHKHQIIWEKYRSPFGTDLTDKEWKSILEQKLEILDFEEDNDGLAIYEKEKQTENKVNILYETIKNSENIPILKSEFGIVPVVHHCDVSKQFNWYMIHTRFNISPKICELICETPGVETFEVYTRYRARVGIGLAFDNIDVIKETNTAVLDYIQGLDELKKLYASQDESCNEEEQANPVQESG
jgi:hypothetical protein